MSLPAARAVECTEVAPMGTAMQEHAPWRCSTAKLYAVGGRSDGGGTLSSSVERCDPALDAWEAVAPTATARCGFAVAVRSTASSTLWEAGMATLSSARSSGYDPAANAWEAVAPLTLARFGAGVAALEGKLYVVDGYYSSTRLLTEVDRLAKGSPKS